jgi:hypothetical protein
MAVNSSLGAATDTSTPMPQHGNVATSAPEEGRRFIRTAAAFVLVGLALYLLVYAASEQIVNRYARRNRFYAVSTAPLPRYDHVILGASHAAALDYQDMNARLEAMTGSKILNLSVVGGGITVNRLLLDYFLTRHQTGSVVYVVDSFVFYSRAWNEDRLQDARLFARAPFDPTLAGLLLRNPATRPVALDYISGFSKINNADRFAPDLFEDETTRFERTYRPVRQIDQQRIDYLVPRPVDAALTGRYLAGFEDLIRDVTSRNIRFVIVRPPLPERVHALLPDEPSFDAALKEVADRQGVTIHDFSHVANDNKFFYDTDHLNRAGVMNFFENHLKAVLTAG